MAAVTPAQSYLANGNSVEMKIGTVDLTPVLKGLPDFAENKEQVETTILNSMVKTYIAGLKDYGQLDFTCNYNKKIANDLRALDFSAGFQDVHIVLSDGTTIDYPASDISVTISGATSGSLMEMTISTFLADDMKYDKEVTGE